MTDQLVRDLNAMRDVLRARVPVEEVVGLLTVEGKSMATSGGLRIEGVANAGRLDRGGDTFETGVLAKAVAEYMATNPVLMWTHQLDQPLGRVESAWVTPGGELQIKAYLDEPEPHTPLADVYKKVKSKTVRGLSVGGRFKRKLTPQGLRIIDAEIVEISVCAVPLESASLFTLAGKSMGADTGEQLRTLSKVGELLDRIDKAMAAL